MREDIVIGPKLVGAIVNQLELTARRPEVSRELVFDCFTCGTFAATDDPAHFCCFEREFNKRVDVTGGDGEREEAVTFS
jgi:hypothetical protein